MKSVVVVQDHLAYRLRVCALKAAHPHVYAVTPHDKPNAHSVSFKPVPEWMPTDPTMPYRKKCWWKADAMGFAAVRKLKLDSDFFWFIESDVVASQRRWKALFADFENDTSDLVAPVFKTRAEAPGAALWQFSKPWCDRFMIMAVFRLSRRAVEECMRCGEEMRDVFSEVSIPSIVHRAGMSMTRMNVRQIHSTTQTMGVDPKAIAPKRDLLSHPSKMDTFDLPVKV